MGNGGSWVAGDYEPYEINNPPSYSEFSFAVRGVEGSDFLVTLTCLTATAIFRKDDKATRTFHIIDSTAPTATWDNPTTYANSSIMIEPVVRDVGSQIVGDAQLRWTENGGGMSPGIRIVETEMLDEGRGGRFRYPRRRRGCRWIERCLGQGRQGIAAVLDA